MSIFPTRRLRRLLALAMAACMLTLAAGAMAQQKRLLNVSYDPTRELYRDINAVFSRNGRPSTAHRSSWKPRTAVRAVRRAR